MNETKFTPGPWIVCPDVGLQIPVASVAKEGLKRNVSHVAGIRNGEGAANANLIAAAPRLYQALEDLIEAWEVEESIEGLAYINAQDALAKARGEG